MPTNTPLHRTLLVIIALLLSVAALTPATLRAQEGPTDAELEADINALARQVHINDLRDPGNVRWVHGDLGDTQYASRTDPGYHFPVLVFETFDGERVRIKEPERPLLINLWASWCPPCIYEFPMLLEHAAEFEHIDLVLLNVSDDLDNAQDFLASQQLGDVPSYVDGDDMFLQMVGLIAYPTTVLIDTDGTLLMTRTGTVSPTFLRFADLAGGNPELGSFDPASVTADDLQANLGAVDFDAATTINADEPVTGFISNDNWKAVYQFEGRAGQTVTLDMIRADAFGLFDPYLVLFGPDRDRLAENDDGNDAMRPDARLTFTLPTDGIYTVIATRLLEADGLDEGDYTLTLRVE
jgi:thiol-disulfide isomerase/thioredoxin